MRLHTCRSVLALSLIATLGGLVAGCSSTPSGPEQPGAAVETRKPDAVTTGSIPKPPEIATVTAGPTPVAGLPPELSDPKSILSKRSIHFDYDRYEIKDEYRDLVTAHARFLVSRRNFKMLIQGNADERGSREYNLALGQKRADAIKKALLLLGAREEQIESVSLGEEKPKAPGHDEAAWAENRRGDMLYSGEY